VSVTDRGWSSAGLPTVGDDEMLWTVANAANLLGPPQLNQTQVRQLIRMLAIEPVGKRRVTPFGKAGRHARVYPAQALIKAYDALSRVL
jgi:hypothetical protein